MAKHQDPKLQPLRLGSGWKVTWNSFYELDPPTDPDAVEWIFFSQDKLLLSNQRQRVLIDLNWSPELKPRGRFYLSAIDWVGDEDMAHQWDEPLLQFASRSRVKIVERLEKWADEDFNWSIVKRKRQSKSVKPLGWSYARTQKLFEQEEKTI